ncbi:substrate-binding periplasmic protein [Rheinheimera pleomorphica]|uniref:substrate-binding periplasmic protein n=1 Tax=Rheinheimera pleomorphica TaxID=2703963 RepID=UPI0014221AC6|nr:transporter substrate-binding domain-containing protein [Rheinheimera pleomorphica]
MFRLINSVLCQLRLAALLVILPAQAAESFTADSFTVALYYPQVPPYMYAGADNAPVGVIPELLTAFFAQQPHRLQYVYENRYRAEIGLYDGKYDASVLAAKWTLQPEELLFSQPVLEHKDYLYATVPFNTPEALSNKTVCLRRHYIYTAINDALQSGSLIRVDAESEFDQFNMLLNKRCQLAYMNEHVASWLAQNHFSAITFYRQPQPIDKTALTLALHPKWAALKPRLDAFIRSAHRNGVIDRALAHHMKKR